MPVITETYVMSLNGLSNDDIQVDSNDIHLSGQTGQTVKQRMEQLGSQIRPLYMKRIGTTDDYVISLPNGY